MATITATAVLGLAAVADHLAERTLVITSVPQPVRMAAQVGALALGVAALRRLGSRALTTSSLAVLAVGNAVLLAVWNQ